MNGFKFLPGILTLAIVFGLASCKVEGPEGPAGKDGTDGNANVKTQIITVTPSDWQGDGYLFEAQKQCPIITADIFNSGVVLCYIQDAPGLYIPMPFTFTNYYYNDNQEPVLYNSHSFFTYSTGVISFIFQDDDAYTPPPTDNVKFKVVAISSSELVAGLDVKNYNQVAKALHLEE